MICDCKCLPYGNKRCQNDINALYSDLDLHGLHVEIKVDQDNYHIYLIMDTKIIINWPKIIQPKKC